MSLAGLLHFSRSGARPPISWAGLKESDAELLISAVGDLAFDTPTHRMTPCFFLAHTSSRIQGRFIGMHAHAAFIYRSLNARTHTHTHTHSDWLGCAELHNGGLLKQRGTWPAWDDVELCWGLGPPSSRSISETHTHTHTRTNTHTHPSPDSDWHHCRPQGCSHQLVARQPIRPQAQPTHI